MPEYRNHWRWDARRSFPYSVKSHRTIDYQKLSAVGRVSRPVYIRVPRHQRIRLQRSQIQLEDGSKRERTLSDIRFRGGTQEFLAVRGYIIQINGMAAVSETFGKSGDRVVPNEIVAGTRIGNPSSGCSSRFKGPPTASPYHPESR